MVPSYGLELGMGFPKNSYLSSYTSGFPFHTAATLGLPYSPSHAGPGLGLCRALQACVPTSFWGPLRARREDVRAGQASGTPKEPPSRCASTYGTRATGLQMGVLGRRGKMTGTRRVASGEDWKVAVRNRSPAAALAGAYCGRDGSSYSIVLHSAGIEHDHTDNTRT